MTDREDIKNMVNAIIAAHEIKEFQKHDELKEELQRALIAARDSVPSSMSKIFQEIRDDIKRNSIELKETRERLDEIFPTVKKEMEEGEMWRMLWEKTKAGGGVIRFLAAVVIAFLVLTGYAKTMFLSWISVK